MIRLSKIVGFNNTYGNCAKFKKNGAIFHEGGDMHIDLITTLVYIYIYIV